MSYQFDTLSLHAGQAPDAEHGARAQPIYLTTSFVFKDADQAAARFNMERGGHVYSRISNPTTAVLEERIAANAAQAGSLEAARAAFVARQPLGRLGTPEEIARRLYAHPDRVPKMAPPDPAVMAKQRALTGRLRGPDRDAVLEARLPAMTVPTLVLFGTMDGVIPPEMGREYKRLLADCHLLFVYDAGHEIGAERPEAFVEAVADFAARRAAFVINRMATVKFP